MLTKKQKLVFNFIKQYQKRHDYAPSLEEIRQHFKLASVSTAHFYLKKLQSEGLLIKRENQPRGISILEDDIINIPLLGNIRAGYPLDAVETPDKSIILKKGDVKLPLNHYALRVEGDSMIEEGIFDGDTVIIRSQNTAEDGQTVVAIIDDNQATLKKIYREKSRIRLQPANQCLLPFYRKEVEIRGVVEKIIRNLDTTNTAAAVMAPHILPPKPTTTDNAGVFKNSNYEVNSIYNSDCVTLMTQIHNGAIDLIFADPPYNLSGSNFKMKFTKSGGADLSTNKGTWDHYRNDSEFEEFTKTWLTECYRILKDGGAIWVAGTYHNVYLVGYLMKKIGFEILSEVLWHKSDATPNLSCTRFVADHETFIWARKGRGNTFNYQQLRAMSGGKQMRSIWTRGKTSGGKKIHPTQKPEWLLERVILGTSNHGDLVFDPFIGSGTTAVTAKRLGRNYLGSEIDPEFFKKANGRISETQTCSSTI